MAMVAGLACFAGFMLGVLTRADIRKGRRWLRCRQRVRR
jgi:hypothetical protein